MSNPGSADFQYQSGEYYQPPNQAQMAPSTVDPNQPYTQQYPPQMEKANNYDTEAAAATDDSLIQYNIRRGFIVKTYGILMSQLFITLCFVLLGFNSAVRESIHEHFPTHYPFLAICSVIMLSVLITFFCCINTARKTPLNYILLFTYTLCMSYYLLILTSFYEPITVVFALGLTIMSTLGLTVYACKTKTDYTFCGFLLFSFVFVLIFCGIFFPIGLFTGMTYNGIYIFWTIVGIIVYSVYLIYDTQLILGEFGYKYDIDDYVIAALNLYIDIIYLFIRILELVGKLTGN